jgi:5-(carboxyamino)imidazole ribonucleotide synthase
VIYDIGIIGGGQLGMMMVEQAKRLHLTCIVLDPNPNCPCSHVADKLIVGNYSDIEKLEELGDASKVLSYEFENVPGTALNQLHGKYRIPQGIQPLLDSQDRLVEKNNARNHGLKTVPYLNCFTLDDVKQAINKIGYPFLYKTRREGYDGHGQVTIKSPEDLEKLNPYLNHVEGIIEKKLDFDYECSMILIRSKEKTIHFPLGRNIHRDGILDLTITPYPISKELENRIICSSEKFMEEAGYLGILTIEYFIKGEEFYFNEMAPRPHNSGHYTIEGCNTNQFLELDKFLIGEELSQPSLRSPTIMKNLLGRDMKNLDSLMNIPNAHLHLYHKTEARPLRKLGHITYTDTTYEDYLSYKSRLHIED